jgi:hypothetical protein
MDEHFDRLEDFRTQRLPEVKEFMVTADAPAAPAFTSPRSGRWKAPLCSTRNRTRSRAALPR